MILENCSYLRDARVGNEARALRAAGYEVSVISPESARLPSCEVIDGIAVYGFPAISFSRGTLGYVAEYAYATFAILILTVYIWIARGFEVLHVANPPDCIVPVVALWKLAGKRIIYDQHDLSPELYAARFPEPSPFLLRLQLWLERVSHRLADHTLVTNESYRALAVSRGGCSPAQVSVLRNGPDLDRRRGLRVDEELRARAAHLIVFAGVTGQQDGLDYLCRALHILRYQLGRQDFLCVIVGDGDALDDVKRLAHELELDQNIGFTGWVSDPVSYFRYLNSADICVAPEPSNSYNDRSTFVKVMEYMLVGKPIVAFDLPESRVTAGDAALFAAPNDEKDFATKILELMNHSEVRNAMGESGSQRVDRELAWQHSVPSLVAVYDGIFRPGTIHQDNQFAVRSAGKRAGRHLTGGAD
jgi:glycosyltransferase involved in cell wall biosynthesis